MNRNVIRQQPIKMRLVRNRGEGFCEIKEGSADGRMRMKNKAVNEYRLTIELKGLKNTGY